MAEEVKIEELYFPSQNVPVEEHSNSCNRHSDCEAAEREYYNRTGVHPGFNFHCHDECCEDCFGC